ncbi:XkdX family protein [Lactiplantibacillus carotarum]|uniref:XkdX family protein n=1 Tax=Lactiplantibacillus carotarum TaxID=2993456 RepID=UPI00298F04F9|nr:XkdX family protein [Lactiplantibacillus carotarum]
MNWYEFIKMIYGWGKWTKNQVADGVKTNHITADQYKEITGDDYSETATDTTTDTDSTTTDANTK